MYIGFSHVLRLGFVICAMGGSAATASAATFNLYSVGNSLTWDAKPPALAGMAASAGFSQTTGYHIRCGQNLDYIYSHPTETCVTPTSFGTFSPAFSGYGWDAITLQPYTGTTANAEKQAVLNLIADAQLNSANDQTQFYIYAAYPAQDLGPGGITSIDFQAK